MQIGLAPPRQRQRHHEIGPLHAVSTAARPGSRPRNAPTRPPAAPRTASRLPRPQPAARSRSLPRADGNHPQQPRPASAKGRAVKPTGTAIPRSTCHRLLGDRHSSSACTSGSGSPGGRPSPGRAGARPGQLAAVGDSSRPVAGSQDIGKPASRARLAAAATSGGTASWPVMGQPSCQAALSAGIPAVLSTWAGMSPERSLTIRSRSPLLRRAMSNRPSSTRKNSSV